MSSLGIEPRPATLWANSQPLRHHHCHENKIEVTLFCPSIRNLVIPVSGKAPGFEPTTRLPQFDDVSSNVVALAKCRSFDELICQAFSLGEIISFSLVVPIVQL